MLFAKTIAWVLFEHQTCFTFRESFCIFWKIEGFKSQSLCISIFCSFFHFTECKLIFSVLYFVYEDTYLGQTLHITIYASTIPILWLLTHTWQCQVIVQPTHHPLLWLDRSLGDDHPSLTFKFTTHPQIDSARKTHIRAPLTPKPCPKHTITPFIHFTKEWDVPSVSQ